MKSLACRFIVPLMRPCVIFLLLAGLAAGVQAGEQAGKQATAELVRLVRQDCGSCHGMTLQGGLGTPLTREALVGKPVDYVSAMILHGRPGTAMPPWKTLLSEADANWIAEQLVQGFPEEAR